MHESRDRPDTQIITLLTGAGKLLGLVDEVVHGADVSGLVWEVFLKCDLVGCGKVGVESESTAIYIPLHWLHEMLSVLRLHKRLDRLFHLTQPPPPLLVARLQTKRGRRRRAKARPMVALPPSRPSHWGRGTRDEARFPLSGSLARSLCHCHFDGRLPSLLTTSTRSWAAAPRNERFALSSRISQLCKSSVAAHVVPHHFGASRHDVLLSRVRARCCCCLHNVGRLLLLLLHCRCSPSQLSHLLPA